MFIIILLVPELKKQCNVGRPEFKLEDLIFLCILIQKMCFFHFSFTCNDIKHINLFMH